jgi:hypothetical protein
MRSARDLPDVGVRETGSLHSLAETLSKNPAYVRLRDDAIGLKTFQPVPSVFALRRDNFSRTSQSEKLVENTGLEPVTSWLQTRRSPS